MSEYVVNVGEFVGVSGKTIQFPEYIDLSQEIVRCRDCAYSHTDEFGVLRCTGEFVEPWDYYNDEPSAGAKITPDGFCAWGIRKEGGDD